VFCVVCFFWVVFSFCIVCIFNLFSVLCFPAWIEWQYIAQLHADVPLRIYSFTYHRQGPRDDDTSKTTTNFRSVSVTGLIDLLRSDVSCCSREYEVLNETGWWRVGRSLRNVSAEMFSFSSQTVSCQRHFRAYWSTMSAVRPVSLVQVLQVLDCLKCLKSPEIPPQRWPLQLTTLHLWSVKYQCIVCVRKFTISVMTFVALFTVWVVKTEVRKFLCSIKPLGTEWLYSDVEIYFFKMVMWAVSK